MESTKFILLSLFTTGIYAADVPVVHNDLAQTGAVTTETALTPSNVTPAKFGRLGSWAIDGVVFAQPLVVHGVLISGTSKDLLIVATMNNSVYAFDANSPGTTIWSNLTFATPYANYPVQEGALYGALGCLSTPVADVTNSKLYVVCDTDTPNWVIRQLSLTTGSTLISTTITGQVIGTGDTGAPGTDGDAAPGPPDMTSGANVVFYPRFEFQRSSLTLANNNVYVTFGGLNDNRPYHGWVIAYSTSTLTQTAIWCASPNGWGGAIWMSGGAPAVDGSGNLYASTGNGTTYDGLTNFTNSVVKLSPSLTLSDWFEPSNNVSIDAVDADVSSNRVILIPGTALVVASGKDFNVYLIDTTCMGHLQGSSGCTLQTFKTNGSGTPGPTSGAYGSMFLNDKLYLPTTTGSIYGFTFAGSTFTTTPFITQSNTFGFAGPVQMTGSSNGASNKIVWLVTVDASSHTTLRTGTLRAFDGLTLIEVYEDVPGLMAKFVAPSISDGKVFVATNSNLIMVYGLLPSSTLSGAVTLSGATLQ